MNTLPDGDLRLSTRDRQRDELIAILESESRTPHRRRLLVPLAAATAVVLVAGLALAVPALRHDDTPAPAGRAGPGTSQQTGSAIERLSAAEQAALAKQCPDGPTPPARVKLSPLKLKAVDAFRFVNPPRDAVATTWVVGNAAGIWMACGFDAAGKKVAGTFAPENLYGVVQPDPAGPGGLYSKSVTRVTVTPLGGSPVEALLRNGFYYAPVAAVRVRGPRTDSTPRPYVVRGYDAAGKLVYTSAETDGDVKANQARCYSDPTGTTYVWSGTVSPAPAPKDCRRTIAWSWLPR